MCLATRRFDVLKQSRWGGIALAEPGTPPAPESDCCVSHQRSGTTQVLDSGRRASSYVLHIAVTTGFDLPRPSAKIPAFAASRDSRGHISRHPCTVALQAFGRSAYAHIITVASSSPAQSQRIAHCLTEAAAQEVSQGLLARPMAQRPWRTLPPFLALLKNIRRCASRSLQLPARPPRYVAGYRSRWSLIC